MKAPRFRIFTLMAVVGLIALNLAVGRVLWENDSDLRDRLPCVGLNALVTQLAVFFLIRNRECTRAFWFGFATSSVVAAILCCYGLINGSDSLLTAVWFEYLGLAQECTGVEVFVSGFAISQPPPGTYEVLVHLAELALIIYLPQLAIALFGGLVTFLPAWLAQLSRRRSPFRAVPA